MAGVGVASPFASRELRWFLDGESTNHGEIRHWFVECAPFAREKNVGPAEWRGRLGGKPDVYLLLPDYADTGIKWREGTLQIKGRVEALGPGAFADRHQGRVERWIKWTYEDLPLAYQAPFAANAAGDLITVFVHKTRALRMFRFDGRNEPTEAPPGAFLERGLGFEMTDLLVGNERYCSIAFEAFPDDALMQEQFVGAVGRILERLGDASLCIESSMAYPAWLLRQSGRLH